MHQRTFLLVSILTVGLVLWLLQPHFGAPAEPRGLRLGSLYAVLLGSQLAVSWQRP